MFFVWLFSSPLLYFLLFLLPGPPAGKRTSDLNWPPRLLSSVGAFFSVFCGTVSQPGRAAPHHFQLDKTTNAKNVCVFSDWSFHTVSWTHSLSAIPLGSSWDLWNLLLWYMWCSEFSLSWGISAFVHLGLSLQCLGIPGDQISLQKAAWGDFLCCWVSRSASFWGETVWVACAVWGASPCRKRRWRGFSTWGPWYLP